MDVNRFYVDHGRPVTQKPITKYALDLLADYMQRRAFMEAVESGATCEFAGNAFLGLGKSASCKIPKSMPDGPYWWFARKVIEGIGSRKILAAREVERSQMADFFYMEFAGGQRAWESLMATHGGRHKIVLKEERERNDKQIITLEVTDYGIRSRAFYNWKAD